MKKLYRASALEAIARKTLTAYDPLLLHGHPSAVPIEKIAQHIGLCIEYQCLRKNGLILGETVFDDAYVPVYFTDMRRYELIPVAGGTIILDESLLRCRGDGRLRFTCAHEIAHWLLHKELYAGTGQTAAHVDLRKSSEVYPTVERQADMLATALLMPTSQVKRAFYALRNEYDPAATLAALFEVSKQAMGIFLREHSLT